MKDNNRKVPRLRFPGFTGDWEQRKYSDVINLLSGQDFEPSDYNDDGHGTPYMTGASCIDNGMTIVSRWTNTPKCIAEKGDVLLVCKGSGCGTIAVLVQEKAHIARQFMALKCTDNLDDQFNLYLANSVVDDIKKDARGLIAGIARDAVLNQNVCIPNIDEQKKIGSFFYNLDNLITLHQRKVEQLKKYKKGMLQKMFPQNGESKPEIRFPGFTDDWEQRKLGEISKTTIGEFVIRTKQDDSYPYPVFNGGSSNTGFYNEFNNEGNKILVSARGANAGFVNLIKTRYWAGNSCYSIDLLDKTKFDTDFIYQEMKRNQSRFTDNQQAANIPSVSKSDVEKFVIEVPQYAEQVKIANYFTNLDNLITLHQREVDQIKVFKKGLLQQMFV